MSDWDRLANLFNELVDLDSSNRQNRLRELAERDPGLASELKSLLGAGAIDSGPVERVAEQSVFAEPTQTDLSGLALGPYTLIEQIGRGGMGVVYRARRTDESFERDVAVKFLAQGLWNESRLEAFLRERRILASLDHPNIARLLDAATVEGIGPYVIMELIDGESIDAYCDQRKLEVRQRLRLLQKVCLAVQSAHQQLIVHRDIKPSNILVTGEGEPKLLDFGIAKLLDPDGDDLDQKTATRVMTLQFASPEQIEGRGVTTATDVYALGLVLYRMLTGRAPHGFSDEASPFEVQKAVLETDAVSVTKIARAAGRPADFIRSLRGDVDNIIAKTLERDPRKRYGTAVELADDIQRHLDGLPVTARAATPGYRLSKFVRRNALTVALVTAVMLALGAAAATTWRQARIARAARVEAEQRNSEMQTLTETLLFDIHEELRAIPGTTEVRASLVGSASEYLRKLRGYAPNDPELAASLVTTYERVGDLQGNPAADNQGDREGARQTFLEGVAFCDELEDLVHDTKRLAQACLRIRKRFGYMRYTAGSLAEATTLMTAAVEGGRRLSGRYPDDFEIRTDLAASLGTLGEILTWDDRSDEGIEYLRESIGKYDELLRQGTNRYKVSKGLASAKTTLAVELVYRERFEEGFREHRGAIEFARADLQAEPGGRDFVRNYWYQLSAFSNSLVDGPGEFEELVTVATEALAIARAMREDDRASDLTRNDLSTTLRYFARAMVKVGRPAEAIPAFEEAIVLYRIEVERNPGMERRVALAQQGMAEAHASLGNTAEACRLFAEALGIWQQLATNGELSPVDFDWPRMVEAARDAAGCLT